MIALEVVGGYIVLLLVLRELPGGIERNSRKHNYP